MSNFKSFDSIHGTFIVNINDHFHADALKQGITHIEPELQMIYQEVDKLADGSVIVDGGTNAGFVLIPIAQRLRNKGAQTRIIGFEPQRVMHAAVSGSVVLNDLWKTCTVVNAALSDKIGTSTIGLHDYTKHNDFGTPRVADTSAAAWNVLDDSTVRTVTLDSLNLPRLDFLKLDVEGSELRALRGGANIIARCRPVMWIEYPLVGIDNIRANLTNYEVRAMDAANCLCVPR